MTTFPSHKTLNARFAFVALLLTSAVLLAGCNPGLHHVRRGSITDANWKEIQQTQQTDSPKSVIEPLNKSQ